MRELPRAALVALALVACGAPAPPGARSPAPAAASSAAPAAASPAEEELRARVAIEPVAPLGTGRVLVRRAIVHVGNGVRYEPGWVLVDGDRIEAVGAGDREPAAGVTVIDAGGKHVTPGIIDPHSHIGVFPMPQSSGHDDANEVTDPVTAGLRAEDGFWPQDPAIERAVAGGVTTAAILPGSANLVGGRGVVLHLVPRRGARAMRLPGAPEIVKMACGENPKRAYGGKGRAPSTRMASLRAMREAFLKAQRYQRDWDDWAKHQGEKDRKPPDRDLALETLAGVLRGDVLVQWHCYQADDMLSALQVADEMGFRVRAFHHALEAYKIRDVLAAKQVAVATWADWWGFKMEAQDGIPENLALVHEAGARAVVHSDSPIAIQMLNQTAGKALASGRAAGVRLEEEDAIRWLTANPAWALGIDAIVGTLEPGKRADLVVWSGPPLSTYARAEKVMIDGHVVWDLAAPGAPWSDFELGRRDP